MFGASKLYKRSSIMNICSRKYSAGRVNIAQTHYEVLELAESCTNAEIKEAFYKKMKLLHPDKNAQNSKNHKLAVAVNEAYAILGKKHSRENYDHYLCQLRWRLSRGTIVSDIPYDRVVFRDRDHFYEDTIGRNRRSYEEYFYRDGGRFYKDSPYYGIKGLKKLPNSYIAAGVVMFMILGSIFLYHITSISTRYCLNQLRERDENLRLVYQSVRENAVRNDMEIQLELLRSRQIGNDSVKFPEKLSKTHEELSKSGD